LLLHKANVTQHRRLNILDGAVCRFRIVIYLWAWACGQLYRHLASIHGEKLLAAGYNPARRTSVAPISGGKPWNASADIGFLQEYLLCISQLSSALSGFSIPVLAA
jgi:hypothetical protein